MAVGAKNISVYIRASCRSACNHPFVLCIVCFLLIQYRYLPDLFTLLWAFSPVILCTAILLGVLLTYGEPNIPEAGEEDWKLHRFSYSKDGPIADDLRGKKNGDHKIESYERCEREIKEIHAGPAAQCDGRARAPSNAVEDAFLQRTQLEGVRKGDASIASSCRKKDSEEEMIKNRDDQGIYNKKESSTKMLKMGEEIGGAAKVNQKGTGVLKMEIDKPSMDSQVDSSYGSSRNDTDRHDGSSGPVSGQSESCSPDASEAEILPMLDELHPLLDSEHPQLALASTSDSDAASARSSQDHESDDVSIEEEVEIQEDEDDDEAQEEKDDSKVVAWTADDQKNLMDVGTSEIERNQRLENLIARRRARKVLRYEMEKNLIDLDVNDSLPSIEELSRFHVEIPQVFAPRKNPFDLPYGSDETIPGSAPSVLLPTQNPFDLPFDKIDESVSPAGDGSSPREVAPVPQRDVIFRRHESFTVGSSFLGDLRQDWRTSRFKPYFFAEKMGMGESADFASLERETSEKSDCKLSSAQESDTVSLVTDQECHKELLLENVLHQASESPIDHDAEQLEPESESSEEGELVHDDDNNMFIQETDDAKDYQLDLEETDEQLASNSLISNGEKAGVAEDNYESSLSSTEENEKGNEANNVEQPGDLQQTDDNSSAVSTDTNLLSKEAEHDEECQVVDPVYDSSPTAIEKTLSNTSALDETMYYADRSCFNSTYSLASLNPAETPEAQSPNVHSSSGGGIWISPSLACVEENESRSKEISVIRESDIIGDELSVVHEDLGHPITPVLPRRPIKRSVRRSSLSSLETESTDGSSS